MDLVVLQKIVGFSAVGLVVVGWLVTSFTRPGRAHELAVRAAVAAMYVALICLFAHLVELNWSKGRMVLAAPLAFLLAVFVGGLLVTLAHAVRDLSGGESTPGAETH